jgi:hypothetical protein
VASCTKLSSASCLCPYPDGRLELAFRQPSGPRKADVDGTRPSESDLQPGIERGNLLVAETTLRETGRVTLVEALQLTALIAVKDPRRHARVGL